MTSTVRPIQLDRGTEAKGEFGPGMAQASVLVVDDETGIRHFVTRTLEPLVGRVEAASTAAEASAKMDAAHFDIVILDNIMPGTTGLEWLGEQRQLGFFADAILITAFADMETAIAAMRAGAVDFILKPFRSNQIINAVARCMDRVNLRRENYLLKYELASGTTAARGRLLGASPAIENIRSMLERIAPLPTPVLFTGDTGTGKEIAARAVHAMSPRADKPFVPINCAALSDEVVENELFGRVSHPQDDHSAGLLWNANGGTLYLDEIAELPLRIQAAILRVIEERRVRPVGALRDLPLDVRFIFATNADLEAKVADGLFRQDLYHRINILNLHMPRLKDRIEDLKELALLFIQQISSNLGVPTVALTEGVVVNMARYDWPGNVRELRNLIERSLILGEFPPEFADTELSPEVTEIDTLQAVEKRHILAVLERCDGNVAEAARRLGVSRKTIDRKVAMWNG
ncbi:MAG: sigma-54 dependent transcriptional regulator [Pseudomonadota bacterium]